MLEYLAYRKWAIDATLFQHCFNIVALYVNYLGQYMNTELPYRSHKLLQPVYVCCYILHSPSHRVGSYKLRSHRNGKLHRT